MFNEQSIAFDSAFIEEISKQWNRRKYLFLINNNINTSNIGHQNDSNQNSQFDGQIIDVNNNIQYSNSNYNGQLIDITDSLDYTVDGPIYTNINNIYEPIPQPQTPTFQYHQNPYDRPTIVPAPKTPVKINANKISKLPVKTTLPKIMDKQF